MAVQRGVHPSAEILKAFGLGKLNDSSSEVVMSHLDQCEDCRKEVASLSGDDFLHRLREAQGLSSTAMPAKPAGHVARAPQPPASQTPLSNLPPELAASQQYEILRELGRGGMGVVYLAKNKLMDRLEVLKVVNKTLLDHPGTVERFLREIRSAAKLSHTNVVAAYSALQMGELLAFAMGYVEGQDLASVVKAQGPLPVPHACFYVQQAAHGLQHAYEKGMVHRDIKPQNLILAREGKKHIVKVLDFGLAKATREKKEDTGLTGEGKMLGTPDYIAPEQTLDAAKADIRADIYSLGCTLYYLLSGHPPFSASSLGAMLLAHQSQEAKPLNLVRPDVPEELAAVVRRMMTKTPAKRYQTPLEVVQALSHFVKQVATPKPSPELSSGAVEAKPVVKKKTSVAPPPPPTAEAPKKQPEPADVWGSLTEGSSASVESRKSAIVRNPRTATGQERGSQKKWLFGSGLAVSVMLLALLGMWAGGVFKVKTPDGTIVVGNVSADADVQVEGQTVTLSRNGDVVTVTHVPKGPHKLKVVQGGREIWSSDVTVRLGGDPIRLKCEPVVADPRPPIPPSDPKPPVVTPNAPTNPDTNKPDVPGVVGAANDDNGFVPLFNGKDLNGWRTHQAQPGNWRVNDDGILIGSGPTDSYLYTDRSDYKDFRLRVEARINDGGNSGVCFRTPFGPQVPEDKPRFLRGYEAQINSTHTDKFKTGSLFSIPGGELISVRESPVPPGAWFRLEVIAEGNRIGIKVNGNTTLTYMDDKRRFTSGHIAVQKYAPGTIVEFRKIDIKELSPPGAAPLSQGAADQKSPVVVMDTSMGIIKIELNLEKAPMTVKNFLSYVDDKFYDGLTFHRVISNFMIQGGGFERGLKDAKNENDINSKKKKTRAPIKNESGNGLSNTRGTIAMARTNDLNSATTQFFINVADNSAELDRRNYCVFGKVIAGMDVVDKIKNVRTKKIAIGGKVFLADVPVEDVVIKSILPEQKSAKRSESSFVPLFNGKDLTGWKVFGGGTGNWKVVDGAIVGSGPKSHLFSERGDYENFHYLVEAMINDRGNSGQYFRTDYGPGFPKGYEAQINSTHGDPVKTGSLYGIFNITDQLHKPNEWFTQEVIAQGDQIIIKVNGKTVVSTHDSRYKKGHFALQQHDAGAAVKFRRIEVKELPTAKYEAPPAANAAAEAKGFVQLFNGKDLKGWKTHPSQRGNWRVENGVLIGSGPSVTSHLYTERRDYTDFHLRLQARINEGGNSGVYLRTPFGPTRPANQPRWLDGYNAKIDKNRLGGFLLDHPTLPVPLVRSRVPSVPAGQWLTLEVIVQGNHIVVKTNGETTAEYTDKKKCFASGHIALQQHTPQTVVEFLTIEIKKLK